MKQSTKNMASPIISGVIVTIVNIVMIFFVLHYVEPKIDMTSELSLLLLCVTVLLLILFMAMRLFGFDIKKTLRKMKI